MLAHQNTLYLVLSFASFLLTLNCLHWILILKVKLICDVINIPMPDHSFDLVVCQAAVEHFDDINQALQEMKRVTKIGGYLYFTVPFLQGYHADPSDFRRYTSQGFIKIMDLSCVRHGISSGPFSVIAWILRDLFTFGRHGSIIYKSTRLVFIVRADILHRLYFPAHDVVLAQRV